MGAVFGKISEETPKYTVLAQDIGNSVCVRKYNAIYTAKCVSSDFPKMSRKEFQSASFNVLAKYIGVFTTPQNRIAENKPQAIPMTAPVVLEKIPMTSPVILQNENAK